MKSANWIHQTIFFRTRTLALIVAAMGACCIASVMSEGSKLNADHKEPAMLVAGEVSLSTFTKCDSKNIVYAGRSMKAVFKGPWADYIGSVNVDGSGVTATVVSHTADGANSKTEVLFSASPTAAAGERKVTAVYKVVLGIPTATDNTFRLTVIPTPTLSGASVPTFQNYFETADVTLSGTNLTGANKITAKAKIDAFNPIIGYAGETVSISNGTIIPAQVVRADHVEAVVRLAFPQRLTKASVNLTLSSDGSNTCSSFGSGIGSGPPPTLSRSATITATASLGTFVKSIDVINSRLGSVAEFTITLTQPVPRSLAGLTVYWKMIPSDIFGQVSGDVPYDGSGTLNRTTISSGNSIKRIKLSVTGLPPGATLAGGTAYIETWISNTNTQEAPYYFKKAFTVTK